MLSYYNNFKNIFFVMLFIFLYSLNLYGLDRSQIKIEGIKNIDKEIIFSIIGNYDINNKNDLNKIIEALYATGNFNNIKIDHSIKDQLIINFDEFR